MSGKSKRNQSDRLRPVDVPEEIIEQLVKSLGIDEAEAADLVVFMDEELRTAPT
jgi:hypothetical protein